MPGQVSCLFKKGQPSLQALWHVQHPQTTRATQTERGARGQTVSRSPDREGGSQQTLNTTQGPSLPSEQVSSLPCTLGLATDRGEPHGPCGAYPCHRPVS